MTANELYKAGKLKEATEAQIQTVKHNPADHGQRLFLFELAAFAGDLDRAQRQIDAVKYDEINLQMAVANYRKLIDSERKRRQLFSDGLKPKFLVEPPEHVQQRLDAINALRDNQPAEAAKLLESANSASESVPCLLNGKPVKGLRDGDDVFGSVLEGMAHGEYFWIPIEQISALAMNPPKFVRDLIWFPARLEIEHAESGEIFLPALYPDSFAHEDDAIKLGRSTDWQEIENGPIRGVGLRTFLVGEDALSLLEWRELQGLGGSADESTEE